MNEQEDFWKRTEDFALEPVPQAERKPWWSITLIMVGIGIDVPGLVLGLTFANGMELRDGIVAVLIGSTMLGILAAFCAVVGSRTGLSTPMITRFAFGEHGARVIALLMGLASLGWFGMQVGLMGNTLASWLKISGWEVPATMLAVLGGVLMTWTAVFGYRSMDRLSTWSVPLMIVLVATAMILMFSTHPEMKARPITAPMGIAAAAVFAFSIFVNGAIQFPNFSRYARNTRHAVIGAFLGLLLGNSLVLIAGMLLAKYTGEADLMRLFTSVHMGVFALIVLVLAQWTTNAANLYSASLSFPIAAPEARIPKAVYAIAAGVIGTLFGATGAADQFLNFLSILAMTLAPVAGAYTGFYFVTRRGNFPSQPPKVVPSCLLAWVAGSFCSWLTLPHDPTGQQVGAGLFTLTGLSPVDGFLVAFAIAALSPMLARSGAGSPTP
jgi:cytosine permease